jgi:hypothetical protein
MAINKMGTGAIVTEARSKKQEEIPPLPGSFLASDKRQ